MKKLIKFLIVAVLCVACMIPAAFAAESPTVSVSSVTAAPNDTVTVAVSISGNPGFASYGMKLEYDKAALELQSFEQGTVAQGSFMANTANGMASLVNPTNNAGNGVLFTATFKVLAENDGTYPVSLNIDMIINASLEDIGAAASGGSVTVKVPHVCTPEAVAEVPATCTEDGVQAHYECECGKLYSDAEGKNEVSEDELIIAAAGHNYEWVIDREATETETGLKHEECTECGDQRNETEIPVNHKHTGDAAWDCNDSKHWHECECGENLDEAAHSFEWVIDMEATETEDGLKHEECTVCGYAAAGVSIPAVGTTDDETGTGDEDAEDTDNADDGENEDADSNSGSGSNSGSKLDSVPKTGDITILYDIMIAAAIAAGAVICLVVKRKAAK